MTPPLARSEVLVLDCQATGSSPTRGHLLEIGWAHLPQDNVIKPVISDYIIRMPQGEEIPRQVTRITGLTMEDQSRSLHPKKAWKKLRAASRKITGHRKSEACPTIIHYARYEKNFLEQLHNQWTPRRPFPLHIICTHLISKILWPHLPRKGLRAVAGYLGFSATELRRSASHVEATAFIWSHIVAELETRGVNTIDHLLAWLDTSNRLTIGNTKTQGRIYPMEPEVRQGLPHKPGVYRMLRSNGDLLYIGKAKSLKTRVNSYFRKSTKHREHILEMLTQAHDLEHKVTSSALEAALLESDEIKIKSPPYNVALKEKERRIYFFTPDLASHSHTPDTLHRLGPVTSLNAIQTLKAIAGLLANRSQAEATAGRHGTATLLGLPESYAPELELLILGLDIFLEKHNEKLNHKHPIGALLLLGKELWLERQEEKARLALEEVENEVHIQEEEIIPADDEVPDPESVTRMMEGIIIHGAHLLRRARWYCLLCESVLAWERVENKKKLEIQLVFEKGAVDNSYTPPKGINTGLPNPPGYGKSMQDRRKQFDIPTYDRMRVLTTEIRRLLGDSIERNIQLRLGPKTLLTGKELTRLLQWL